MVSESLWLQFEIDFLADLKNNIGKKKLNQRQDHSQELCFLFIIPLSCE